MTIKHYLVLPDLHFPEHCLKYLALIDKVIKIIKPNGIVQLGDALDFHQISRYDKDPSRKNTLGDDIALYNETLNRWSALLPKGGAVHLIEGNHCYRMQRYIAANARELFEICRPLPELLRLPQRNADGKHKWHWHSYNKWNSCRIGDCVLMHGFYYNQHATSTNLAKYKMSTISGHTHRVSYATDGIHYAASLGHGSDEKNTMHQPTPSGWTQAFGILYEDDGKTSLEIITVKNGRCILHGQKIQA